MSPADSLNALPQTQVPADYIGLVSLVEIKSAQGTRAFLANSDLDLDTDGLESPGVHYEPTHQRQTSIDPAGTWLNSNEVNFVVIPGGFPERHNRACEVGTLATVFRGGRIAHAVIADQGPRTKFGEGSIALHRALGFERIRNGRIVDAGIDPPVGTLFYIGRTIAGPFNQDDIDRACAPLWAQFV